MLDRMTRATLTMAAMVLFALAGCGDDDETTPAASEETQTTTETQSANDGSGDEGGGNGGGGAGGGAPAPDDKPSGPAESGAGDPRVTELEREAARTVREFIAALDARDGEDVCALLAPGALDQVELPRPGPSCAASLEASIGYRDPRGLPVWEGGQLTEVRSVELGDAGTQAAVTATVIAQFADRDEPSVEDDVVYLNHVGGEWLVAKPSATLYRAIGAEAAPSALTPP
jgi:hypothetical protein